MSEPVKQTRARATDAESAARLARLMREQFDLIWRLLRRIGVSEREVDAAVEEVFVAASQRIGDVRSGSERSFLFSTALHVAARVRRARREHAAVSDRAPALEKLDASVPSRENLGAELERLPLELRVVFVLAELEQLRQAEIAQMVGIPQATIGLRLAEAREQFATHVESDWALSLVAAARAEQPSPALRAEVLAAIGLATNETPARFALRHVRPEAPSSSRSGALPTGSSRFGLSLKWLFLGWIVGLLGASVIDALSDASAAPAPSKTQSH